MSENYKQDEQQLVKLLKKDVRPVNVDSKLKITIFYKNRKLKNIRNTISAYFNDLNSKHHAV